MKFSIFPGRGEVLSKDHIFCACSLPLRCLQRICSCGHLYFSILLQSEMKNICKEESEIQQYLVAQNSRKARVYVLLFTNFQMAPRSVVAGRVETRGKAIRLWGKKTTSYSSYPCLGPPITPFFSLVRQRKPNLFATWPRCPATSLWAHIRTYLPLPPSYDPCYLPPKTPRTIRPRPVADRCHVGSLSACWPSCLQLPRVTASRLFMACQARPAAS